jgi:thiol-disulfide isomerase/thioredoxin
MELEPVLLLSRSLKGSVLALTLLAGACDRQTEQKAQPQASAAPTEEFKGTIDRSQKGTPLPALTVTDAAGRKLDLQSLKGKPVLMNLWATWCAPCVAELPLLDKLAEKRGDALKVLTIDQDMSKTEAVADFLKQRGVTRLEPWLDPKNDLAFKLGAQTLPVTVYYDAQGKEVWRFIGGHDWSSAETDKMLAEGVAK